MTLPLHLKCTTVSNIYHYVTQPINLRAKTEASVQEWRMTRRKPHVPTIAYFCRSKHHFVYENNAPTAFTQNNIHEALKMCSERCWCATIHPTRSWQVKEPKKNPWKLKHIQWTEALYDSVHTVNKTVIGNIYRNDLLLQFVYDIGKWWNWIQ